MLRDSLQAVLACVVSMALCAVAYPAIVYGVGHGLFPHQAEGSLIERDGQVIGSALIAQPFSSARYFAPRPSAAGATGYAANAASGSNLAATNPALRDRIAFTTLRTLAGITNDATATATLDRYDALQAELTARQSRTDAAGAAETTARLATELEAVKAQVFAQIQAYADRPDTYLPADLVTASGSGLDPEISPAAAYHQAARVARARNLPEEQIRAKIAARVDRSGAWIGAPARVNVLLLNVDLDR